LQVTPSTRFWPAIDGKVAARRRSAARSNGACAITPFIAPDVESRRTSARVSIPETPGTLCRTRNFCSDSRLRQFDGKST
jgi:hypothetical protein